MSDEDDRTPEQRAQLAIAEAALDAATTVFQRSSAAPPPGFLLVVNWPDDVHVLAAMQGDTAEAQRGNLHDMLAVVPDAVKEWAEILAEAGPMADPTPNAPPPPAGPAN